MSGDGEKAAVVYSAELAEAKLVILNACPLQADRVQRRPVFAP